METLEIKTTSQTEMIDITDRVRKKVKDLNIGNGICHLYVPHTTAAITINESADRSVARDILMMINKIVPFDGDYQHLEGNSPAHIKASIIGPSEQIIIQGGDLVLGTWQGIFFCEFDGPRRRKLLIQKLEVGG